MKPEPAPDAPHAPRTSRWKRWLGPFYFTGVFWYRLPLVGLRLTPNWVKPPALLLFRALFFVLLGGIRRAIGHNQQLVHGPAGMLQRWRWAWHTMGQFGWCYLERYEQFQPGFQASSTVENREAWDGLIEAGQGFILVTAHLGHWEMGSTLPTAKSELEIHLVREPEMDPEAQALTEELVGQLGGARYVTHFAEGELDLGLELASALQAGHIVALQGDRPRNAGQTIEAPLFGAPFPFPRGVPAMARLTRTPLLPVFLLRTGRRSYHVLFRDPIHVDRTRNRDADLAKATHELAKAIESGVKREPMQWFCFRKLDGRTDQA